MKWSSNHFPVDSGLDLLSCMVIWIIVDLNCLQEKNDIKSPCLAGKKVFKSPPYKIYNYHESIKRLFV